MTARSEASYITAVDLTHFGGKGGQDVGIKGKVYRVEVELAKNIIVTRNRGRRGSLGTPEPVRGFALVYMEVFGRDDVSQVECSPCLRGEAGSVSVLDDSGESGHGFSCDIVVGNGRHGTGMHVRRIAESTAQAGKHGRRRQAERGRNRTI